MPASEPHKAQKMNKQEAIEKLVGMGFPKDEIINISDDSDFNHMFRVRIGDVLHVQDGVGVAELCNESRARLKLLVSTERKFKPANGPKVTITSGGKLVSISPFSFTPILLFRLGPDYLKKIAEFRNGGAGTRKRNNQSSSTNEQQDDTMPAKQKTAKKPAKAKSTKGKAEAIKTTVPSSKGKLGDVMGFSTCSVIRRLGMDGVSVAHARAIMKVANPKARETTVSLNISAGSRGIGAIAQLSKDQVAELKAMAKDPALEKAEDKK